MKINVLTLFPNMFSNIFSESIVGKSLARKIFELNVVNMREAAENKRKDVDDKVYGGGRGRLIKPEIIEKSLFTVIQLENFWKFLNKNLGIDVICEQIQNTIQQYNKTNIFPEIFNNLYEKTDQEKNNISQYVFSEINNNRKNHKILYMSPRGKRFSQDLAIEFSHLKEMTIICGKYEGIDGRILQKYDIEEISVGDFVLTGGEIPAMAIIDATVRLLRGTIKNDDFSLEETFTDDLIEYDQFTTPQIFSGISVPKILTNGNHSQIRDFRRKQSKILTKTQRYDMWSKFVKNKLIS